MPGQSFVTWRFTVIVLLLAAVSFLSSLPAEGPVMLAGMAGGAIFSAVVIAGVAKILWLGFWHVVNRAAGSGESAG